jgi:hypothetical protein
MPAVNIEHRYSFNLIDWMRESSYSLRAISWVVLLTFVMLILAPTAHAVQEYPVQPSSNSAAPEAELSKVFDQIVDKLEDLQEARDEGEDITALLAELKELGTQAADLDGQVMDNFQKIEEELKAKQLPHEILQRHYDMVTHYQAQRNAWMEQLESEMATGFFTDLLRSLKYWIGVDPVTENVESPLTPRDPKQFKRQHQPFDPEDLPNRSLKPNPDNKPKTREDEFIQSGLYNTPFTKIAALGDFTFDQLEGASNPAYLTETDEITLSQTIRDKASELNYDPIQINHFVRNNIEWIPSWGAIQNTDLTLSARRGNAMDIASLTIALLRASKIPARYVHGSIDVPKDKFLNWAGGFENVEAAGTFAASAGIPITSIITGGQVSKIRMEHVWVEAAIDYFPSRGAKNRSADAWVQLDPSYKQYEYLQGLDSVAISGIDPEQLAQSFIDSGQINEAEGWVTGFDPAIIEQAQTQAQKALEQHITDNMTNPTVGDVIGGRKTIIKEYPVLPSSLPNRIVVEGARYDKLPSRLQQRISWSFAQDILSGLTDPVSYPMARVNNEKITLSFRPATEVDEQALAALLPEGEITDISQLPTSISSYLINVVPELKINGVVEKTGNPMRLGEELDFVTQVTFPHKTHPPRTYKVIAGSFLSVNAIAQSVSPDKLTALQNKLELTGLTLINQEPAQARNLTREDILGDMFQAGSLGYYAQQISLSQMNSLQQDAHFHLAAGTGTVGYEPNVDYFFGMPRTIKAGGVVFDIPFIQVSYTDDGNLERLKQLNFQNGVISSVLEHVTPEVMFYIDPGNPPDAISAVKALQKASAAGQRIYQITQSNMNEALPNIHHNSEAMNEIRAALNRGMYITTHTDAVSIPGWSGAGYVILDPATNIGAWKISGGSNGSIVSDLDSAMLPISLLHNILDIFATYLGIEDLGALASIGKSLSIFGAILSAVSIGAQCSEDVARVLILLSTFWTLVSLAPGLLIGLLLTPIGALLLGVILSIGFFFALNYLSSNLCRPTQQGG